MCVFIWFVSSVRYLSYNYSKCISFFLVSFLFSCNILMEFRKIINQINKSVVLYSKRQEKILLDDTSQWQIIIL